MISTIAFDNTDEMANNIDNEAFKFSRVTREALIKLVFKEDSIPCPYFGDENEDLVSWLEMHTIWAAEELREIELLTTKREQRELLAKGLESLNHSESILEEIFQTLSNELPHDADLESAIDNISKLVPHIEIAFDKIEYTPTRDRQNILTKSILSEMTIRILQSMENQGLKITATANPDFEYYSPAVKIMKLIGRELGQDFSYQYWRNTINKVKTRTPSLKKNIKH